MATANGFDTAATVGSSLATSARSKYGTAAFYVRYLRPAGFPMTAASAVGECRAMYDAGARFLAFVTVPAQSRLSGTSAMGRSDAVTFCNELMNVYHAVGPLVFPSTNLVHVYLDVEATTNLSAAYWSGWAGYVNGFAVSGHGLPLYAGMYCAPAAPTTNCSAVARSTVPWAHAVWSLQPQPCSTCGRPFGSIAWQPKSCSQGYPTTLWQFMIDGCPQSCGGASLPNVDLDMTNPSLSETGAMMRINVRP